MQNTIEKIKTKFLSEHKVLDFIILSEKQKRDELNVACRVFYPHSEQDFIIIEDLLITTDLLMTKNWIVENICTLEVAIDNELVTPKCQANLSAQNNSCG